MKKKMLRRILIVLFLINIMFLCWNKNAHSLATEKYNCNGTEYDVKWLCSPNKKNENYPVIIGTDEQYPHIEYREGFGWVNHDRNANVAGIGKKGSYTTLDFNGTNNNINAPNNFEYDGTTAFDAWFYRLDKKVAGGWEEFFKAGNSTEYCIDIFDLAPWLSTGMPRNRTTSHNNFGDKLYDGSNRTWYNNLDRAERQFYCCDMGKVQDGNNKNNKKYKIAYRNEYKNDENDNAAYKLYLIQQAKYFVLGRKENNNENGKLLNDNWLAAQGYFWKNYSSDSYGKSDKDGKIIDSYYNKAYEIADQRDNKVTWKESDKTTIGAAKVAYNTIVTDEAIEELKNEQDKTENLKIKINQKEIESESTGIEISINRSINKIKREYFDKDGNIISTKEEDVDCKEWTKGKHAITLNSDSMKKQKGSVEKDSIPDGATKLKITVEAIYTDYIAIECILEPENDTLQRIGVFDVEKKDITLTDSATIKIKPENKVDVEIETNVMNITDDKNWWNKSDRDDNMPTSQNVYNSFNLSRARSNNDGKIGSAVGNVGEYVYVLVKVKRNELKKDKYTGGINATVQCEFTKKSSQVAMQRWKKENNKFSNYDYSEKKYVSRNKKNENDNNSNAQINNFSVTLESEGVEEYIILRMKMDPDARCYTEDASASIYNKNKLSAEITNIEPQQGTEKINNISEDEKDSDTFMCRKCNVSVDMYISNVVFNNNVEKKVIGNTESYNITAKSNDSDELWKNSSLSTRNNQTADEKSESPVYIEKGDYVEYTIKVTNNKDSNVYNSNLEDNKSKIIPTLTVTLPCKEGKPVIVEQKTFTVDSNQQITISLEDLSDGNVIGTGGVTGIEKGGSKTITILMPTPNDAPTISTGNTDRAQVKISATEVGTTKCDVKNITNKKKTDYDYYAAKEYNVTIDTSISAVAFKDDFYADTTKEAKEDNRKDGWKELNNTKVYKSNNQEDSSFWMKPFKEGDDINPLYAYRRNKTDDQKDDNPVYIEKGDIVVVQLRVSNTHFDNDATTRKEKYCNPSDIQADITLYLPDGVKPLMSGKEGDGYTAKDSVYLWHNHDDRKCYKNSEEKENCPECKNGKCPGSHLIKFSDGNGKAGYKERDESDGKNYEEEKTKYKITITGFPITANKATSVYIALKTENMSATGEFDIRSELAGVENVNGCDVTKDNTAATKNAENTIKENPFSKEHIKIKQYNVSIDTYIEAVAFKDNYENTELNQKQVLTNGYTADENGYITSSFSNIYKDNVYNTETWWTYRLNTENEFITDKRKWRKNQTDDNKQKIDFGTETYHPAHIERGDYVIYALNISDKADRSNKDYMYPGEVKANIQLTNIPEGCSVEHIYKPINGMEDIKWETDEKTKTITIPAERIPEGYQNTQICVVLKTDEASKSNQTLNTFTAQITGITNKNGCEGKNNGQKESSDYFDVKEYEVSVDTYVTAVAFKEEYEKASDQLKRTFTSNTYKSNEGDQYWTEQLNSGKTSLNDYRSRILNKVKENSPANIEKGDYVACKILLSNTDNSINGGITKDKKPYYNPASVTADITVNIPWNCEIEKAYYLSSDGNYTVCDSKKVYTDVGNLYTLTHKVINDDECSRINEKLSLPGKRTTENFNSIYVILSTADDGFTNRNSIVNEVKVTVDKITNINDCKGKNRAEEMVHISSGETHCYNTSSDYFKVKEYDVSINTYITAVAFKDEYDATGRDPQALLGCSPPYKKNTDDQYWTENIANSTQSTTNAYNSLTYRAVNSENTKYNTPAYIEKGDYVIYAMEISNTNDIEKRTKDPYNQPSVVNARIEFSDKDSKMPKGCTIKSVYENGNGNKEITVNYDDNNKEKPYISVEIDTASTKTVYVVLETTGDIDDSVTCFKTTIEKITNRNDYEGCNNPLRGADTSSNYTKEVINSIGYAVPYKSSLDFFKVKEYNVSIDTYITAVAFTNDYSSGTYKNNRSVGEYWTKELTEDNRAEYFYKYRSGQSNGNKQDSPAYIEIGDYVVYAVNISNTTEESYKQPSSVNTVVVFDTTPNGCKIQSVYENENENIDVSYNSDGKQCISVGTINPGSTKTVYVVLETSTVTKNYNVSNALVTKVTQMTNRNGYEGTNHGTNMNSADWFRVKEYSIAIDQYISKVEHVVKEPTEHKPCITYSGESRRSNFNNNQNNKAQPVYVEYGDKVTYTIKIYNTTQMTDRYNPDYGYYDVNRAEGPYRDPSIVKVDLKGTLPENVSDFNIDGVNTYERKNTALTANNIYIGAGEVKTITITLTVNEAQIREERISSIEIVKCKNKNNYEVKNNSTKTTSSDKYKLNDYNTTLTTYISSYGHQMADYNYDNHFISQEDYASESELKDRSKNIEGTRKNNPLKVEKHETLEYTTKLINNAQLGHNQTTEAEDNRSSYGKYPTRVRPTEITQTVDFGLEITDFDVRLYKAGGNNSSDVTVEISSIEDRDNYKNIYTIKIKSENIILSPGDYIIYTTTVRVTESNMSLKDLAFRSEIKTLTNINSTINNPKEVTNQSSGQKSDGDYVRLKDLVIAGKVWVDNNKNGYNDDNSGDLYNTYNFEKSGVTVKLYGNNTSNGKYEQVGDSVTTDVNGFYTFGRQWKAPKDIYGNYTSTSYINYYVEFEYDGLKYKATEVYGGSDKSDADGTGNLRENWCHIQYEQYGKKILDYAIGSASYKTDSNAYEFSDKRKEFNSGYETISYNKAHDNNGNSKKLTYNKQETTSTLIEDASGRMTTARSFVKKGSASTDDDNTKTLFLYPYQDQEGSDTKTETEYLKFINLGLVERNELDLSLDVDVYSVKTTINGEEMTYNFNNSSKAYSLDLYQSDYKYRYGNYYEADAVKNYKKESSEQDIEVTYRITMTNNEIDDKIPVEADITELAIYYDKNFMEYDGEYANSFKTIQVKSIDNGLLSNKSIQKVRQNYSTQSKNYSIYTTSNYAYNKEKTNSDQYNVLYLSTTSGSDYIKEGDNRYIDITFTVKKDDNRNLKIGDLKLIAEIGAYKTRYADDYANETLKGQIAGLVDGDSNPGNLGLQNSNLELQDGIVITGADIEDKNYYEDDTDIANINISVPGVDGSTGEPLKRTITGMVWEDARSKTAGTEETGIQYIGNGTYNITDKKDVRANSNPNNTTDNDKPVANIKVSLMEVVQKIDEDGNAIYYECPAKKSNGDPIEVRTGLDGSYTLEDFIPGYYKVRFTYGNEQDNITYNGQDYKSTTYYNESNTYYASGEWNDNIGAQSNFGYFDEVKAKLGAEHKSDAQDDEIRRLNVNSYSETMTAIQAKNFSEINSHIDTVSKYTVSKYTQMYAESAIFYTKPENVGSSISLIENATDENFNSSRKWNLENLDFGLEYRPESSIILDKNIESIELVTSDKKSLAKIYFTEDGKGNRIVDENNSKGNENVQFLPNTDKTQQGFVYINMDSNILEGCTIKVDYKMDAENHSEVDRINQNLEAIKDEARANENKYNQYKVTITQNSNEDEDKVYTYSANATAAQLLGSQYYKDYEYKNGAEKYRYLTKIKKPYQSTGETKVDNITLQGTGYYGMYLGQTYYTGTVGKNDVVATLKVDSILDYIDNDFTFNLSDNSTKDRLWRTTTSEELYNHRMLDFDMVNNTEIEGEKYLIDKDGIQYDTDNRSNLALSVNSSQDGKGNVSLSQFLTTSNAKGEGYIATINAMASKILSPEDITQGRSLNYENIAEVIQYTTLTGRRTKLPETNDGGGVIGNANVEKWSGYETFEDDTDASEIITISPPTGLTE